MGETNVDRGRPEMRLAWTIFRVWTCLTITWWVLAFTVAPGAANPAAAFSLFWVLGLPALIHFQLHPMDE